MTLPTSIEGPQAKFERAREHINGLKEAIAPFCDANSYLITHEIDSEVGRQFWQFNSDTPVIPLRVSLILGDALYNLRSSLEHAIWQLVLLNGQVPGDWNAFPIFKIPSEYASKKKGWLKGVSEETITMIDRMQPYNREYRALWALHRLNITDKHRHLYLTNISMLNSRAKITGEQASTHWLHVGPVERGTILLTVNRLQVDVEFQPGFDIAFSHSETDVIGASVIATIDEIESVVSNVLVQLGFPL